MKVSGTNTFDGSAATSTRSFDCELIASTISITSAFTAYGLSAGTADQPIVPIAASLGFALFALNLPSLWRSRVATQHIERAGFLHAGFILLMIFLGSYPSLIAVRILSTMGIICLAVTSLKHIRVTDTGRYFCTLFWGVVYSFVVGQMVWGGGWRNPLDLLSFAQNGSTHSDPPFHNAVVAMLSTHGVCSTGLDGLVPFSYHHAAHWLAATLGRVIDTPPYVTTTIVMPIIIPAILVYWALQFATCIGDRLRIRKSWTFHVVLLTGLGGFLPANILEGSFISWPWTFSMDSQIMGLTIATVAGTILVSHAAWLFPESTQVPSSKLRVWYLLLALGSLYLLMLSKITVAHLFALVMVYTVFRSAAPLALSTLFLIATFLVVRWMSPQLELNSDDFLKFSPFGLWFQRVPFAAWPLCIPVNVLAAMCYAMLRLKSEGTYSVRDLVSRVHHRTLLDVEIVLLLSFAGMGLTTVFGGRQAFNSIYYQNTAQFLTLCCLAALSPSVSRTAQGTDWFDTGIAKILAIGLLGAMFLTALINSGEKWQNIVRLNMQSRGDHFASPLGVDSELHKPEMRVLLRQGRIAEAIDLNAKNTKYTEERINVSDKAIIGAMHRIRAVSNREERKQALLWIPRSNRSFWDLAPDGRRWLLPMYAVAITEMSLIDGLPEEQEPSGGGFGFSAYPNVVTTSDTALSLADVKLKASNKGFSYILELRSDGTTERHSTSGSAGPLSGQSQKSE